MTPYLARLRAGDVPTVAEWNQHLITFHRAFADATSGTISLFRADGGATSYELLARRVRELAPQAHDVLDLGCGNGTLLAQIARAYGKDITLHGVDLSEDEIARARRVAPLALLRCADAADGLGQNTYDVVLAHLTLAIVSRLRTVVERIHAALRPGALFACIVEDLGAPESIFRIVGAALASLGADWPSFRLVIPEREAIEHDEGLSSLLTAAGFHEQLIERTVLRSTLSLDQLWTFTRNMYPFGLLERPMQDALRDRLFAFASEIGGSNGYVTTSLPLRLVTARAD
ncbi:MAG TPA: class I SAM-dependent methyltransferase [Candidatus Baltobacteraceae bacterium]|nr:class I SAM-dependent methyltransferase [Candidatus Baltobacteraceae bacterium]